MPQGDVKHLPWEGDNTLGWKPRRRDLLQTPESWKEEFLEQSCDKTVAQELLITIKFRWKSYTLHLQLAANRFTYRHEIQEKVHPEAAYKAKSVNEPEGDFASEQERGHEGEAEDERTGHVRVTNNNRIRLFRQMQHGPVLMTNSKCDVLKGEKEEQTKDPQKEAGKMRKETASWEG